MASQKASERRHNHSALGTLVTMSELHAVTMNTALRAVRERLRLSQDEFARAVRRRGTARRAERLHQEARAAMESGLVSTPRETTPGPWSTSVACRSRTWVSMGPTSATA